MTKEQAQIIIGNIPIDGQDECYSITEYQEAKTMAIKALERESEYKEFLKCLQDIFEYQEKYVEHIESRRYEALWEYSDGMSELLWDWEWKFKRKGLLERIENRQESKEE